MALLMAKRHPHVQRALFHQIPVLQQRNAAKSARCGDDQPHEDSMIIDDGELSKDLNVMCRDIGERLAGSAAEKQAADHISARLRAAGLPDVQRHTFPCTQLVSATIEVSEPHGRSWRTVEALPIVGAPSTPDRKIVEGKIVWIT